MKPLERWRSLGHAPPPARRRSLGRARLVSLLFMLAALGLSPPAVHADMPLAPQDVPAGWSDAATTLDLGPLPPDFTERQDGTVHWVYPRAQEERVDALQQTFAAHWPRVTEELGAPEDGPMVIALARDTEELRRIAPPGHPPPRYAVGVAYPAASLILLTLEGPGIGSFPDTETVLVHELSHLALHRAVGGRPVPRWLSEGVAIEQAREQGVERMQRLFRATTAGELHSLPALDLAFSAHPFEVDLAYAQSADLVSFLRRDEDGPRKFQRLIRNIRRGEPFEDALRESFYYDLVSLEQAWKANLHQRYGSWPLVLGGSLLWFGASILLVLAWRKRRREHHRRVGQMARDEAAIARLEALLARRLRIESQDDEWDTERFWREGHTRQREEDVPTVSHEGDDHTLH